MIQVSQDPKPIKRIFQAYFQTLPNRQKLWSEFESDLNMLKFLRRLKQEMVGRGWNTEFVFAFAEAVAKTGVGPKEVVDVARRVGKDRGMVDGWGNGSGTGAGSGSGKGKGGDEAKGNYSKHSQNNSSKKVFQSNEKKNEPSPTSVKLPTTNPQPNPSNTPKLPNQPQPNPKISNPTTTTTTTHKFPKVISDLKQILNSTQQPQDALQDIIKYIRQQLLSASMMEVKKHLIPILSQFFKINVQGNYVRGSDEIDAEMFGAGKRQFFQFCRFLDIIDRRMEQKIKEEQFQEYGFELLRNRNSCYWTNASQTSLLELIIKNADNPKTTKKLLEYFQSVKPYLKEYMYTPNRDKTLLYTILQSFKSLGKNREVLLKIMEKLSDLIKAQNIDLKQFGCQQDGNDYKSIILEYLSIKQFDEIFPMYSKQYQKNRVFKFKLVDFSQENPVFNLEISQDMQEKIMNFFQNIKSKTFDQNDQNFHINLECFQQSIFAKAMQGQKKHQGILIPAIPCQNSKFLWKIIDIDNKNYITLTKFQSEQLTNSLKNDKKAQLTKDGKIRLEIESDTWKAKIFIPQLSNEGVQIRKKQTQGRLFWLPEDYAQFVAGGFNKKIQDQFQQIEGEGDVVNNLNKNFFKQQNEDMRIPLKQNTHIFKNLGILFKHINIPPHLNIQCEKNNVIVSGDDQKSFIENWLKCYSKKIFLQCFDNYSQNSKKLSISGMNQKSLTYIRDEIKKIEEEDGQTKINVQISSGQLKISGVIQNEQYVKDYCNYLSQISLQQIQSGKTIKVDVGKDNVKFISRVIRQQNKSSLSKQKGKQNDLQETQVRIQANNQKQLNDILTLTDQNQHTIDIQQVNALELLRKEYPNFEQENKIKITFVGKQKFSIKGKPRKIFQFYNLFLPFIKAANQLSQQEKIQQMIIPNKSKQFDIYSQILKSIPNVTVIIKGADLCIKAPKKLIPFIFKKTQQEINQFKIQMLMKSPLSFQIEYIDYQIAFALKKTLQQKLAKSQDLIGGIKPIIQINQIGGDVKGFSFELKISTQHQNKLFSSDLLLMRKRFSQYTKLWKVIRKTNQIVNSCLLPFRIVKNKDKDIKKTIKQLIKLYSQKINQKLNILVHDKQKMLLTQFKGFIQKGDLSKIFKFQGASLMKQQFKAHNQGIFMTFLQKEIQKKIEENKQTRSVPLNQIGKRKAQIYTIIKQKVQNADNQLKNEKIDESKIAWIIMTIKTLVKLLLTSNLPIIDHLSVFRKKFESSDVIVVKTGTGSGKSTVIPPYLVALGCKRVVVTQPRRLPCRSIYQRIRATIFDGLVGYSYAGQSVNSHHPLHYTTDGMLNQLLKKVPQIVKDIDVLMLDEIHQRSKSIDLILLKIQNLKIINPKLKIILCSATIDSSILNILNAKTYEVFSIEIARFPVKEVKIDNQSIIQRAVKLSGTLLKNEKMLVFFPGVEQIQKNAKLLQQKYHKKAYGLFSNQSEALQDQYFRQGQIFFSTSIAETSLTFQNLRYVLDTRMSRTTIFNPNTFLYEIKDYPSSDSSIRQRMGRVGRERPGEYHYEVLSDKENKNKHQYNYTQLQRIDITNVILQLLQNYQTFSQVENALKTLIPKDQESQQNLQKKLKFAKPILKFYQVIDNNGKRTKFCFETLLHRYGNLGNISYNYALYESEIRYCSYQVIAIISFIMIGSRSYKSLLPAISSKQRDPSGDIMTIARFLIKISKLIDLERIQQKFINRKLLKVRQLRNVPSISLMTRVFKQMKKLMAKMQVHESGDWDTVQSALVKKAFKQNIYFKQQKMGGVKNNYQKVVQGKTYQFNKKEIAKTYFSINKQSLVYKSNFDQMPNAVISLSAFSNSIDSGLLSICSKIEISQITTNIILRVQGAKSQKTLDEQALFKTINMCIKSYNWPLLVLQGKFYQLYNLACIIDNLRRNNQYVFNLIEMLQNQIKNSPKQRQEQLKEIFQKINLKDIFTSLKFQCDNIYGSKMTINHGNKTITLQSAKSYVINLIQGKIKGFFSWFRMCQNICIDDLKVLPRQLKRNSKVNNQDIKNIEARINMIVNSEINFYTLKSWTQSEIYKFRLRTMRMVAVCWVLVNQFGCTIKGGFVRDWVIRGKEWLPAGDLSNLMSINKYNGHIQVDNQMVTPSDIDVELPSGYKWFDCKYFENRIKSLGIKIQINEKDQWRKHVLFDYQEPFGGFTADLIESYCYISHDQVDFDVNAFYIQKDRLGGLGLKIPMKIRAINTGNSEQYQVSLQSLVDSCINSKMRKFKQTNRDDKFKKRGWQIDTIIYQPTIYKNYKTTYYPIGLSTFQQACPQFKRTLPGANIKQVIILKNHGWESMYDANKQWIAMETKNINERMLFHGTSAQGKEGIIKGGFDGRYMGKNGTYFGIGHYFADDASMSDGYAKADGNGNKYMFVCWVALGNQESMSNTDFNKRGPQPGFHSILARKNTNSKYQYIINRTGQARPLFLVTYI